MLAAEERAGFSGAVLIARGDTIVFERARGAAARTGISPDRLAFWIASCSKQITATAVMRLVETGRLDANDSLGRFFPRARPDQRGITIHQLLTHTSGLASAYSADGVLERERAIEAILKPPLDAPPGTRHIYSNNGYVVLAAIVEIAAGMPYDTFVRDSLLARAGLAHTGLWGHEDPATPIAPVADPKRVQRQRPTIYRDGRSVANWGYRGPTGIYATPRDLAAWIAALRSGRVIGPQAFAALTGRHVLVRGDSTGESYAGYGWGVRVEHRRDVSYGHTGGEDWLGHTSVLRFTPAGEVIVVLGSSGERDGVSWATRVNRGIRRALAAHPDAPPP
jgi:CubicO group peptidase (beta-lactamase class C family)